LAFGKPFLVNTSTEGDQTDPAIAVLPEGGFVIVWGGPPVEIERDLRPTVYGRSFDEIGRSLGPEFKLEGVYGWPSRRSPAIGALGDSLLVELSPTGEGLVVARFGIDGSLIDAFPVVGVMHDVDLVSTEGSDILFARSDRGSIQVQRFRRGGEAVGPAFVVDSMGGEYPVGPRIGAAPDGSFVITWWAERAGTIWARRYDASDAPLADRFAVVEGEQAGIGLHDVCATQGTDASVIWADEENRNLFRRFTREGQPLTPTLCSGARSIPSLVCTSGDQFVLAGILSSPTVPGLYVGLRAFDERNRAVGSARIALQETDTHAWPKVAVLGDETLVVVWSACPDGSLAGCDVFAQRFALTIDPDCTGDCDGDGSVSVDELISGVDLSLSGESDAVRCASIDADTDCVVSIVETVRAVNNALAGCD
jgi:hypothetical protein